MGRLAVGRHYLQFKNGEIDMDEFLDTSPPPLYDETFKFSKVTEKELGSFEQHEVAHTSILKQAGIGYHYELSEKGDVATNLPDLNNMKAYAHKVGKEKFIKFLAKYNNPKTLGFVMAPTDEMIYRILSGKIKTEDELINFLIVLSTKS